MHRKLFHRNRSAGASPTRKPTHRVAPDAELLHPATGHGSRMPSQAVSTRFQRPY